MSEPSPFSFSATLWLADASSPWVFVTVPATITDVIDAIQMPRPGFGSVKVGVTVGDTRWHTSLFPDSKSGAYILPVKRSVRESEGLAIGDTVDVAITVARP